MTHGRFRRTYIVAMGLLAAGTGLATAARSYRPESEEAKAIKVQFARQIARIQSLDVAYKLETKSNLSAEKLRAPCPST